MGDAGTNGGGGGRDALKPVWDVVLESGVTGPGGMGFATPTLRFDDGSTRLIVQNWMPVTREQWWAVHRVDVAGASAAVMVVVLLWVVGRVMRRGRVRGRWYCRGCNYDVTGAVGGTTESAGGGSAPVFLDCCPECGRGTAGRGPVRGRPRLVRVAIPALVLGVGLCVAAVMWAQGVERYRGLRAWPAEVVGTMCPWWPVARPAPVVVQVQEIRAYGLKDHLGPVVFDMPQWSDGGLAPDGRHYAGSEFDAANKYQNEAVIADTRSARMMRVTLGTSSEGFARFQGWTPDGKEAVYTMTGLVGPGKSGDDPVRVLCVAVDSGAVREVAKVMSKATQTDPTSWQVPTVHAAVRGGGAGGDPEWAVYTADGPKGGTLVFGGAKGTQEVVIGKGVATMPMGSEIRTRFRADGSLLIGGTLGYSFADGAVMYLSPPTPLTPAVAWGMMRLGRPGGATVTLEVKKATALAGPLVISPDGRWCAGVTTLPDEKGGMEMRLRVWELPEK